MKPGELIHYKGDLGFRFCPLTSEGKINNRLRWKERILVDKRENKVLLFVESLDYSGATATSTAAVTATAARKELKETGKILGGTFLTPNGKLIWVSHYDFASLSRGKL